MSDVADRLKQFAESFRRCFGAGSEYETLVEACAELERRRSLPPSPPPARLSGPESRQNDQQRLAEAIGTIPRRYETRDGQTHAYVRLELVTAAIKATSTLHEER